MEPTSALRRIAYLLEADGAETYRVRAFRKAAAAVAATDPERLAELATTGRLRDLDGVGDVTAQVVAEALAGDVPSYLAMIGRISASSAPITHSSTSASFIPAIASNRYGSPFCNETVPTNSTRNVRSAFSSR